MLMSMSGLLSSTVARTPLNWASFSSARAFSTTGGGTGLPGRVEQGGTGGVDMLLLGRVQERVRIMAMQQQAHGAGLIGDRTAVDRLIDTASGLLSRVDDDLPWGNACRRTPGYLEVQRATCYGRLRLGREAASLWSQVLAEVPASARRDRGVYLARHAIAAAGAREPEQALEIAGEAAEIAAATRSARMVRELATLERVMRPWQDAPVGRDLAELLAPVTEGV
ncbi:hypothetical protein [Streptomyces sp. NPDC057939]|uniref:hypothetical protein n=1 Tax=Streptomyces sp. NPDC057939 TaxID=3346284 RepID=UPI0036E67008